MVGNKRQSIFVDFHDFLLIPLFSPTINDQMEFSAVEWSKTKDSRFLLIFEISG